MHSLLEEKRAVFDLHIHSSFSDGLFSPGEILHMAKEKGLAGLSITDHDVFSAYTNELFALAARLQLKLVSGIELSSLFENKSVHVLGYNFRPDSVSLQRFIEKLQQLRYERNLKILEKLKEYNIYIAEKELYPELKMQCKGRPQIASLIVQKQGAANFQQAFNRYLKEGACCYMAASKFETERAIEEIHLAGGKAVLAHPHQIASKARVLKILKLPFDGLEVFYSRLPLFKEQKWLQIAREKNLLITGGSDFHGTEGSTNFIGSSWIDAANFKQLLF